MKQWKCLVCGYIHEGDEPPDECPICGADKTQFVDVTDDAKASKPAITVPPATETPQPEPISKTPDTLYAKITTLMVQNHLHPIAVHTPNGVIPVAVIFLLLALYLNNNSFELAAYYNLIFVLVAMPMVLFSGFIEWQNHYGGARTPVFLIKIGCGLFTFVSLTIIVVWRFTNPEVASSASPERWIYFLMHIVTLGAVGVAGHLGGKLVFGKKKK